jgi:hypothetical protein
MSKLLEKLRKFLQFQNSSALEKFVLSKSPKSVVEIEYWQREYEQNDRFVWGRGL